MQDEAERLERERAEKRDVVTLTEDDGAWRVDAAEAEPTVGKAAVHRPTVRQGEAHRAARLQAEGVPHRPWQHGERSAAVDQEPHGAGRPAFAPHLHVGVDETHGVGKCQLAAHTAIHTRA